MKHIRLIALGLLSTIATAHAERVIVDQIVARVDGSNILQSDLQIPRIANEGAPFSLDEAINNKLLNHYAIAMKMLPTAIDVERQFVAFKAQNGLNELPEAEFENQLKENGFTLESYKQQLGELMANENVKRAEISEKIVVSTQEVEEVYKKEPEYTKEAYHLSIATISEAEFEAKKAAHPDLSMQDAYAGDTTLTWEDHGFIETADLNSDYTGIQQLQPGQIMEPLHKENSYELVKLVAKQEARLKTLAERYNAIERDIQNKRKNKIVKDLETTLRAKATIVHLI